MCDTKKRAKQPPMPKAITGIKYRELLEKKQKAKEEDERVKKERQIERERKRKEREEEKERKKSDREEKRQKKLESEKSKKEKRRNMRERLLRELNEESDSDNAMEVGEGECYACEMPYDAFIACTKCFRHFHLDCVNEDFVEGLEEVPFECKYC